MVYVRPQMDGFVVPVVLCGTTVHWDTGTVVPWDSGRYCRVRGDEVRVLERVSDRREETRAEFGNGRV